nr:uncharacterized protein BN887_00439 [Melanopsichium pennsylvanicum 4]
MSPESVYSPASIYSPEATDGMFASLHDGLLRNVELSKEGMEIIADSVATELSYVGMPRTDSVMSELSEASSARSSSSGAFAFSRSMSNSSLVSGGTFSSASSNASESPERKMNHLANSTSFEFSPTKMSSSVSLASTAGTSIFELESEMQSTKHAQIDPYNASGLGKLKTPFQLKGSTMGAGAAQAGAGDSSDCETPTLASCRQMSASAMSEGKSSLNRQLGLSMDLSDLAEELGLGRLSQIGLAHLKGIESLAEEPIDAALTETVSKVNASMTKKISPIKPPKSSARGVAASTGLSRFGAGMSDITTSAAMSPLPVSIAGRPPQTPPRTNSTLVDPQAVAGRKVWASGVPKVDGGFGLGLDFAQSPSPQAQPRKAAITPGSYSQHVVTGIRNVPNHHHNYIFEQQPKQHQQQEAEVEWVGVAM